MHGFVGEGKAEPLAANDDYFSALIIYNEHVGVSFTTPITSDVCELNGVCRSGNNGSNSRRVPLSQLVIIDWPAWNGHRGD